MGEILSGGSGIVKLLLSSFLLVTSYEQCGFITVHPYGWVTITLKLTKKKKTIDTFKVSTRKKNQTHGVMVVNITCFTYK